MVPAASTAKAKTLGGFGKADTSAANVIGTLTKGVL
jgi:hypothetical protein